MSYFESKRRSLVKAITWRILAMIVLDIVSLVKKKTGSLYANIYLHFPIMVDCAVNRDVDVFVIVSLAFLLEVYNYILAYERREHSVLKV